MSALRGLSALLAVLCIGCGRQYLVWYGHSPDRVRRVEVVERDSRQVVMVDSLTSEPYRGVALATIRFSDDSRHFAYAAETDSGWTVVRNGIPGRVWTGVGAVLFGPGGRLAYVASDSSAWRVIVDERVSGPYEAVMQGSLTFSPEGSQLAYVVAEGDKFGVVVDDRHQGWYDGVRMLRFGPDANLAGYVGRKGTEFFMVLGERSFGPFEMVADFSIGPAGRLGAVVRTNGQWRAWLDGTESEVFDNLGGICFFGSGQYAYSAERDGEWFVVRNGNRGRAYDRVKQLTVAGESVFYEAGAGDHAIVVADTSPGPRLEEVGRLNVSPDGGVVRYLGRPFGGIVSVFRDGVAERVAPGAIFGTLVVSGDGEHWAYLAASGDQGELEIVMDDGVRVPLDLEGMMGRVVIAGDLNMEGNEEMLRAWIKAELEAYIDDRRTVSDAPLTGGGYPVRAAEVELAFGDQAPDLRQLRAVQPEQCSDRVGELRVREEQLGRCRHVDRGLRGEDQRSVLLAPRLRRFGQVV